MTKRPISTRQTFLSELRLGLSGVPRATIDDIISDYTAHFTEAQAAGRSEAAVAQALGDPTRLARELRAEAGLRRWEEDRSAAAAIGAVIAVLGLATFDVLILLPILLVIGIILAVLILVSVAVFAAGGAVFCAGLLHALPGFVGSAFQAALIGAGLSCGAASGFSICILVSIGLITVLGRFGRLHYQLVNPQHQPAAGGITP